MYSSWKLQDAKARFSELVERALTDGPQHVTRRGSPAVVVISEAEYERTAMARKGRTLVDLMRDCPAPEIFDFIDQGREASDFGRQVDPIG